ncbi:MAG: chemotaxis protein [Rhodospirillaceae bacterium]
MSPSETSPAPGTGTRRYRGVLRQIEIRIRTLFPEINRANRAMYRLADLSEDMRILSLNAELAAGRAGQRGAAVRALTQYTRGLVRRLVEITASASGLQVLYDTTTDALRTLRHLRQLEEATVRVDIADITAGGHRALMGLERVRAIQLQEMANRIAGINNGTARLALVVRVVDDVVSQAASIATNIAAEAVNAGSHEAEFKAVSETMTRYVEELRIMNDQTARGLRGALEGCKALMDASGALTRHQPGPAPKLDLQGAHA